MKNDHSSGKHSHNNRESREGLALKLLRETNKLSLKDVAKLTQIKAVNIDHFENRRKFYSSQDIDLFLGVYQFSRENFNHLLQMNVINRKNVNHYLAKLLSE